jgi:hypothetical protein
LDTEYVHLSSDPDELDKKALQVSDEGGRAT